MTQVNLLPTDVRERQRSRRLTAGAVAAVCAVIAVLFFIFVLQAARLSNANQKLKAQQAINADLQSKIGQLQQFAELKTMVTAREALTAQALQNDIAWSGILRDISMVIPGEMWLTGMTGTASVVASAPGAVPGAPPISSGSPTPGATPAPTTPTAPAVGGTLVGGIQFQGMASDHPVVAQWLSRLAQINGWVNPWISTSTRSPSTQATSPNEVQFSGSVDLTDAAAVQGSRQ